MTTKSLFSMIGEIHRLPDWENFVGKSDVEALKSNGILQLVPIEKLKGYRQPLNLGHGVEFYEIVDLNERYCFNPVDFSHEPILITESEKLTFAKLNIDSYLLKIREANDLKIQSHSLSMPPGSIYLGGKSSGSSKTIHFLAKSLIDDTDAELFKKFLSLYAKNSICIVVLTDSPAILSAHVDAEDFSKTNFSIGPIPSLNKSFKIEPRLIYRASFGYNLGDVVAGNDPSTLIIDSLSGQVIFGRKVIIKKGDSNEFKFIKFLSLNPDKHYDIDHITQTILEKDSWEKASKPIRDLKNKFLRKLEQALENEPNVLEDGKSLFPNKGRENFGQIAINTERVKILIYS